MLSEGLTHTSTMEVTADRTAVAVGSGNLPVLATPMMVALMENAAMLAVASALEEGSTTVGTEMNVTHEAATLQGKLVSATATLVAVEGRKLTFEVAAHEGEKLLGKGLHQRFVVDEKRFMDKLLGK